VLGAAVPEAAVDEESHVFLCKDKVRMAVNRHIATPSGNPVGTQDPHESQFCGGIARLDGHDFERFFREKTLRCQSVHSGPMGAGIPSLPSSRKDR
jgi:hypothetical protein